jgi:hypothetical protein
MLNMELVGCRSLRNGDRDGAVINESIWCFRNANKNRPRMY